jgi:FAD synthase
MIFSPPGVPTANLADFDEQIRRSGLPNGVYFGWGCLPAEGKVLGCVANIGKSPTFVGEVSSKQLLPFYLILSQLEVYYVMY